LDEPDTYFEVPSSHFLARSGAHSAEPSSSRTAIAASSTPRGTTTSGKSGSADGIDVLSSASFVTATQGNRRWQSDSKSASSVSFDARQSSFFDDTLQPGFSSTADDVNVITFFGGHQARPNMPDTSTLAAADFDVDVRSGFLPPEEPVRRLEGIEEELWENALDKAQSLPLRIGGGGQSVTLRERRAAHEWRRSIRRMMVLHPSPQITNDIRYARRAHVVLSFLAHFYMHSQPASNSQMAVAVASSYKDSEAEDVYDAFEEAGGKFSGLVPAAIAVPWVAVSSLIDVPPVLTYASTVMWNWHFHDVGSGFTDDNMRMTTTFSNTESERHFYMMSLLIEKHGVSALTLMRRTLDEAFVGDTLAIRRIRVYVRKLGGVIEDLQSLLHGVRDGCDPKTFYWGIRPWFNAGDSFVDRETGEKGWIFEGVEEYGGKRMLFTGPSAGQSSLIHAIDVFLGVDHSERQPASSVSGHQSNATFMERMQTYMPGPHRQFLNHLRSISFVDEEGDGHIYGRRVASDPADQHDVSSTSAENHVDEEDEEQQAVRRETHPIRALLQLDDFQQCDQSVEGAARRRAVERLREVYNVALTALKHLRDEHMRIATLYIISQMRLAPPPEFAVLSETLTTTLDASKGKTSMGGAKGTGGTDLVSFLKACRTNTIKTLFTQTE
jgi:hypothetical protein